MNKIFFVILHYQSLKDTVECVNSILCNKGCNNCQIVIVDNCSPNKSGKKLDEIYTDNERIKVLLNDKNEGFARGNNVGFKFAKSQGANFIILINNDTLIKDDLFCKTIIDLYDDSEYAVLGPDIYNIRTGYHQNPYPIVTMSKHNIKKLIIKNEIGLCLNFLNLDSFYKNKKKEGLFIRPWAEERIVGVGTRFVLQGSCLIFSSRYIEKFDGLYDKTFMYYEEHILADICNKLNLTMLYSPRLQILHKEGVSTGTVTKAAKKKWRFQYKESIKSLKAYLADCN